MDNAGSGSRAQRDPIDLVRAAEYGLLAELLGRAPDRARLASLSRLSGDDTPIGAAHRALAKAAAAADPDAIEREFFGLFIGVGRGELLPYASFYMTGFLNERPLAAVRSDLKALGVERAEGLHEPEDHLAILCDVMAGIAAGRFGDADAEAAFFARHVEPWAGKFFDDLAQAKAARFYGHVGALGRAFMDIESGAFALPA